jgi:ArsR family transcriptional regulator, arsenate/arsenite/antimonite-responsive transcriptional repressor
VKALADTFKALSDETRLQIMTLLMENDELCVCDFVGTLGQTQSKVSRHLRYLYNAGLVSDRRAGLWMHYRIAPDLTPERAAVLAGLSTAVDEEQRQELRRALQSWLETKAVSGTGEGPPATCCTP